MTSRDDPNPNPIPNGNATANGDHRPRVPPPRPPPSSSSSNPHSSSNHHHYYPTRSSYSSSASFKGCCCCLFLLFSFLALLVLAVVLVIVLAVKPKKPQFDLQQVGVQYMGINSPNPTATADPNQNPTSASLSLNIRMLFSAANPNKVGIEYGESRKQLIRCLSRVAKSSAVCPAPPPPARAETIFIVKLRHRRSSAGEPVVPEGHVPVYVGDEMERFVVTAELLNHPVFVESLNKSTQEYSYEQKGILRIPCHLIVFERVLKALYLRQAPSRDLHDLLNSISDDLKSWEGILMKGGGGSQGCVC